MITPLTLIINIDIAIDIVMVNTTLPANIGSAARAMHTMGLSNLVLVDPKHPIDDTSVAHAAGATALLSKAKTVATLKDAIADSQLVFAASSRSRHLPRPVINPSQAASIIEQFLHKQQSAKISILFGREDRGLTNDELALADYHIQIDANPTYPVLNVASAVQVITSFIYAHFANLGQNDTIKESHSNDHQLLHHIRQHWDEPAINKQQQQHLQSQLITLMTQLGLADADDLRLLPNRLNRLLSRTQLDIKEYQLLQSLINRLLKKIP